MLKQPITLSLSSIVAIKEDSRARVFSRNLYFQYRLCNFSPCSEEVGSEMACLIVCSRMLL